MNTTTVVSSVLVAIAYDPSNQLLDLEFRDRTIYRYRGVPIEVHSAFLGSPSKGVFFNRAIRRKFPYELLQKCRTPLS